MSVHVTLAVALPERQEVIALDVPEGSTIDDVIRAAALEERFPGTDFAPMRVGIWSRICRRETPVREGDRVELYRPLTADARQMRRSRARRARGGS